MKVRKARAVTLARVTRAARARLASELRYREAVEGAAQKLPDGTLKHSYADIARAAGVSRQAVRQLLLRGAKK